MWRNYIVDKETHTKFQDNQDTEFLKTEKKNIYKNNEAFFLLLYILYLSVNTHSAIVFLSEHFF